MSENIINRVMTFEQFKKIIDQFYVKTVLFLGSGEPFFAKDLFKMIKYCKSKNIITRVYTNGRLIDVFTKDIIDSVLDEIVISIDSSDPEIYKKIKRSELDKVLSNIKILKEYSDEHKLKTPTITTCTIIMKDNIDEIEKIVKFINNLGIDVISFTTIRKWFEQKEEHSVEDIIIEKAFKKIKEMSIDNKNKVFYPIFEDEKLKEKIKNLGFQVVDDLYCNCSLFIGVDGTVYPCNRIRLSFGNLLEKDIKEIQKNEEFMKQMKEVSFSCSKCRKILEPIERK
jgi:MoaA/NifB/PqqE/SkfB family radical SAM enzyme